MSTFTSDMSRHRPSAHVARTVVAVLGASLAAVPLATPAAAAAGCSVAYTVTSAWPGGFGADVVVTNLGDPVAGWTLGWTFPDGQRVSQGWNGAFTQSGAAVSVRDAGWNASIATGARASVGFVGTSGATNGVPTSFTLNGVACTGAVGGAPAPTTPAPTPTPSATPTSGPTPTPTPSASPTPSPASYVVAADGTGRYRTVQAAVDALPSGSVITVKPGTYREIVTVPAAKTNVTLRGGGTSAAQTVIVNNRSNAGGYGTFGSATFFGQGAGLVVENLTLSNDYGVGSQAVAANVTADRSVFRGVRFLGNQDTLLINSGARTYVVDSYVEGTVDFIFGNGTAVFDRCSIYQKRDVGGPITAARTPADQQYGLLVHRSTVTGLRDGTTQLGRPWGPDAQVVFRESSLSATIATGQPWIDMSGNPWQGARFFEYRNTGAGATVNGNRKQLTDAQATQYTPQRYLAGSDGWNPVG